MKFTEAQKEFLKLIGNATVEVISGSKKPIIRIVGVNNLVLKSNTFNALKKKDAFVETVVNQRLNYKATIEAKTLAGVK